MLYELRDGENKIHLVWHFLTRPLYKWWSVNMNISRATKKEGANQILNPKTYVVSDQQYPNVED